ncbi:hypothetical protein, partial [Escherichia coli]|uniref:hypothetical protein n=1 Tax=Escherichia coli TaxID=562 RepID=UPI001AA1D3ED
DFAMRIAQEYRFSDIAILSAPQGQTASLMLGVTEALLYHSRVPILLDSGTGPARFDTILLAWDGSAVALSAIRAAMP